MRDHGPPICPVVEPTLCSACTLLSHLLPAIQRPVISSKSKSCKSPKALVNMIRGSLSSAEAEDGRGSTTRSRRSWRGGDSIVAQAPDLLVLGFCGRFFIFLFFFNGWEFSFGSKVHLTEDTTVQPQILQDNNSRSCKSSIKRSYYPHRPAQPCTTLHKSSKAEFYHRQRQMDLMVDCGSTYESYER